MSFEESSFGIVAFEMERATNRARIGMFAVTSRDFTLTPGGAYGQMKEGGDLVLTCAGTVAEGANRSGVRIEYVSHSLASRLIHLVHT